MGENKKRKWKWKVKRDQKYDGKNGEKNMMEKYDEKYDGKKFD
jgi:hypothetical protein